MRTLRLTVAFMIVVVAPSLAQAQRQVFVDVLATKSPDPLVRSWLVVRTLELTGLPQEKVKQEIDKAVQRAYDDGAKGVKLRRQVFLSPTKGLPPEDLGEAAPGQGLPARLFQEPVGNGANAVPQPQPIGQPAAAPVDVAPVQNNEKLEAFKRSVEAFDRLVKSYNEAADKLEADKARFNRDSAKFDEDNRKLREDGEVFNRAADYFNALPASKKTRAEANRLEALLDQLESRDDAMRARAADLKQRKASLQSQIQDLEDRAANIEKLRKVLDQRKKAIGAAP